MWGIDLFSNCTIYAIVFLCGISLCTSRLVLKRVRALPESLVWQHCLYCVCVRLTWEDVDISVLRHIGLESRVASTLWSLSDALYRVCIMYKLRFTMTHEHICTVGGRHET